MIDFSPNYTNEHFIQTKHNYRYSPLGSSDYVWATLPSGTLLSCVGSIKVLGLIMDIFIFMSIRQVLELVARKAIRSNEYIGRVAYIPRYMDYMYHVTVHIVSDLTIVIIDVKITRAI